MFDVMLYNLKQGYKSVMRYMSIRQSTVINNEMWIVLFNE